MWISILSQRGDLCDIAQQPFGSSPWATRRLHSDGPGQRYLNGPPRAFRLLVLACTLAFKITRVLVTLQVSD